MGHRPKVQNGLSHVVFVVDESDSMKPLTNKVKEEVLAQIKAMVDENPERDHEIRATLYTFQGDTWGARTRDDHTHCVLYDMDVMRMGEVLSMESMQDWYKPNGMTAMMDATCKAIDELKETPERYGRHSYLIWVLTDGIENASVTSEEEFQKYLNGLDDNWRVGFLVPNKTAEQRLVKLGVDPENILIWDAKTKEGLAAASKRMQTATATVLRSHQSGITTRSGLFSTGEETLNASTVKDAGLKPVPQADYERLYAHQKERVDNLVNEKSTDLPYRRGNAFYQLTKRELVQAHKKLVVWDRQKKVLLQGNVRALLNLPDGVDVTIPRPTDNDRYEVYIQSGADNRVVPEGKHAVIVRDHRNIA